MYTPNMLSYRHAFHAGNHADILKHLTLTLILDSLTKKEKPFTVFDTHAGAGLYDLNDSRLNQTEEAKKGILKLLETQHFLHLQKIFHQFFQWTILNLKLKFLNNQS